MSSECSSQLYGSRASLGGFHPSLCAIQPVRHWFESKDSEDGAASDTSKLPGSFDTTDSPSQSADRDPPGAGTVLAVLDTGIQYDHLAFCNGDVRMEDKVIEHKNFYNPEADCEDYAGHGTECAGMACGLSFKGLGQTQSGKEYHFQFTSPAPGAKLMVCKVCNNDKDDEQRSQRCIVEAIQYIVEYNKSHAKEGERVDVISMSFGYKNFDKQLALAIQEAITNDIIIVCCASNDGMWTQNPITYPGRLGHVLCIGSCDKYGQPSKFSSVGKEVDFVELGENIWVPSIDQYRNDVIRALDGTSYATPAVAGLICRLLQDLRRLSVTHSLPNLANDMHNVWCMRDLLKTMSTVRGLHDNARGFGRLEPMEYFKRGDEERIRICNEILGSLG